jgi:hypothetical protein
MCKFVEDTHVMPGWGCCHCRTYNGLQRTHCRGCGTERHEITIPSNVKQCACGFGWIGDLPTSNAEGTPFEGRCPSCKTQIEKAAS